MLVTVCNDLSTCVHVFPQNSATVINTPFLPYKKNKVKFKLMSLPDDDILIKHVAGILHIHDQWNNLCSINIVGVQR